MWVGEQVSLPVFFRSSVNPNCCQGIGLANPIREVCGKNCLRFSSILKRRDWTVFDRDFFFMSYPSGLLNQMLVHMSSGKGCCIGIFGRFNDFSDVNIMVGNYMI